MMKSDWWMVAAGGLLGGSLACVVFSLLRIAKVY